MLAQIPNRLAVLCVVLVTALSGGHAVAAGNVTVAEVGEFGGDLDFLRRYYTPPQHAGESNHYFDLWTGRTLPIVARFQKLLNNHALFIDSHGGGHFAGGRIRYGFYPHGELLKPGESAPYFSPRDIANVMGSAAAGRIHNIIVGGCNAEGIFKAEELRRHFVNATNITHMMAGEDGFKPLFYSAFLKPSWENKPVYALSTNNQTGREAFHLHDSPIEGAKRVSPYMAALFKPRALRPYRTQVAGRDLLEPRKPPILTAQSQNFFGR